MFNNNKSSQYISYLNKVDLTNAIIINEGFIFNNYNIFIILINRE